MKINNRTDAIKLRNAVPQNMQKSESFSEPQDRVSLSSCKEKEWTVLFYLDGNSNLSRLSLGKLRDLEKNGSDENINLIAQVARPKKPLLDLISGDWSGVRRYYVTKNPDRQQLRSKEFQTLNLGWRTKLFCKMAGDALKEGKERGLVSDGIIDKARFLHRAIEGSPYNSISSIISDTKDVKSDVTEELDNVPMSNPESLREFLEWGIKNYPAKHYMVVVQGHGSGPGGILSDKDGLMSIPELEKTMKKSQENTGVKPDILVLDACLMGSAEVAYQLKDIADIMIASQEVESGYTIPVDRITASLKDAPCMSSMEFAKKIVEYCKDNYELNFTPTMSAIDLKEMKDFGKIIDDFSLKLSDANIPDSVMKSLVGETQHFHLEKSGIMDTVSKYIPSEADNFVDLYNFTERILSSQEVQNKELLESARQLQQVLSRAVVANESTGEGYGNSHGLSMLLPDRSMKISKKYKELALSQETGWDEFIST
ncbi:MAG: clostripain-related cysteine peptidase [Candidatus Eremiobacterota bacterium]